MIISPLARTHIDDVYEYYYFYSEVIAYEVISEIEYTLVVLLKHPFAGKVESDIYYSEYTLRSLPIYKGIYKIIYYCDGNLLYILAIWDCRQNPEKLVSILDW